MDVIFDREGKCLKCKGTNKCISCGGSGRNRFDEKLVCPTCKGSGKCNHFQNPKTKPLMK